MKYLLTMYQPDGGPPPDLDLGPIMHEIGKINEELRAAGAWVFAAGLTDASSATVVHASKRGSDEVLITDGPYIEGKEHMGGVDIIEAADLDEAIGWARKLSVVTGLPMEVRPFQEQH
jgi:hypothetical protein